MTAGVRGDDSVEFVDSVERGKLVDEDIAEFVLMLDENGEVVAIFVIVSDEDGRECSVVEGILEEIEVTGKLAVFVETAAVGVVNDIVVTSGVSEEVVAIFVIVSDEDGRECSVIEGILEEMEVMGERVVLVETAAVGVVNAIVVTNGVSEEVDVIGIVVEDFDAVRIVVAIVTGRVVTCGVLFIDEPVDVIAEVVTLDRSVVGECCCDVVDIAFCVVFTEDGVVDSEDEYSILDCMSVEVCCVPEVPVLLKSVVLSLVDGVS